MQEQPLQGAQELLCINAEKVYDWVILQQELNRTVTAGEIGSLLVDPCGSAVSNLTSTCYLVDPVTGDPLPENAEIDVEIVGEREDRQFVVNGALVTLQRVSFIKTIYVQIEFTGLNGATPFQVVSDPIPIEIPESVYLCAPEGTRLVVRVTDVDCSVDLNCATGGTIENANLFLTVCQSIQAVADVTLELVADFCQPRDNILTEQCPTPVIPPQCPVVFPGTPGTATNTNE